MKELTVGLFNDSFPPTIDGVANVTLNYAKIIGRQYGTAIVATPYYPHVRDDYDFEVLRYPSAYLGNATGGYRAGYPFDPRILRELESLNIDIIHTHCPFISTVLARMLRNATGAPIVFTYHTKFDIDLEKVMASDNLRRASIKFILSNINACDDVWVVSEGAGQNLRHLGYTGSYTVMQNGTDFDRRRALPERVDALRQRHEIPCGCPVFLFVGRMMWYKGVRLSLDGLKLLKESNTDFRFILIGDGADCADIERYVAKSGIADHCIFTGSISDREVLRDYFTLADLFLFPSDFDTNGMVVCEGAACDCPSVVLRGSAAAEGIVDRETGILIDQTPQSMFEALQFACQNRTALRRIGQNAAQHIYRSWDDAVAVAYKRYEEILSQHDANRREDKLSLTEALESVIERLFDDVETARGHVEGFFTETRDWLESHLEQTREHGRFFDRRKK